MCRVFLCALCLCACVLSFAKTVTMVCPEPSEVRFTKQPYNEFWRAYRFNAEIKVSGLMPFGEVLPLEGRGNDVKFDNFSFATWTDQTFLCWYDANNGPEVITTGVDFYSVFDRCYFPGSTSGSPSDCDSRFSKACPLVCELSNSV